MTDYGFQDQAFQLPGASGNFVISLTGGPGRTIKGYEIILSGATALDTITAEGRMSFGFCDGTNQRSVGIVADDGTIAIGAVCGGRIDTATVIQMPAAGVTTLGVEAAHVSLGVDQVTINVSAASTLRGIIRMHWGDDFACLVESLASAGTIGNFVDTSDLGVPVDLILGCSVGQAFVADGAFADLMFSLGGAARLPAVTQCSATICAEDQEPTRTSSGVLVRNDSMLSQLTSVASTVSEGGRIEASFLATSVRLTTRNANASFEGMYMSMSFGGAKGRCAVPVIDVSTTGVKPTTDTGFRTRGLFLLATQRTDPGEVNVVGSGAASGRLSIGFGLPGGIGRCVSFTARDNQLTSDTKSGIRSADICDTITDATTHDYIASLPSIDAAGYSLNVSDAAAAVRLVASISMGDIGMPAIKSRPRRKRALGTKGGREGTTKPVSPSHGRIVTRGKPRLRVHGAAREALARVIGGRAQQQGRGMTIGRRAARGAGARARPSATRPTVPGKAQNRVGAFFRILARMRAAFMHRRQGRRRHEIEQGPETPTFTGVPTSPDGANAMAGSDQGDNTAAGSAQGANP